MLKIENEVLELDELSDFGLGYDDLNDFCNENDLEDVYICFKDRDITSIYAEYGTAGLYEFIQQFEAGNLQHDLSAYVIAVEAGYGNDLIKTIEFTNENLVKIGNLWDWNFKNEFAAEMADGLIDDQFCAGGDWIKSYFNYDKFQKDLWADGYSYYQGYSKRVVFRDAG